METMQDQENMAPIIVMADSTADCWWSQLAQEASHVPCPSGKVETFARQCYKRFFIQQTMNKESYFQCCGVAWMVQKLDSGEWTASQLWSATRAAMAVVGDETCLAGWLLPKLEDSWHAAAYSEQQEDEEERYVYLWLQFWKRFYQACQEREQAFQSTCRPAKRQRTTYHYYNSKAALSDDIWKGAYKLPTVVLLASILLNHHEETLNLSWPELDLQVHRLAKIFKTLTVGDIEAGLAVVGMQCLLQGRQVPGLTPCTILEGYINRTGEANLGVLKETLHLDHYYPLRAVICEHLMEPVYSGDKLLTEEESQATIQACGAFMNRETPSSYIQTLPELVVTDDADQEEKDRDSNTTNMVPARVLSPRYPLMTHLGIWLEQGDMWRATNLVRQMEQQNNLDGLWKEDAYLVVWQHLLRQGQAFLDGNGFLTVEYNQKRELLYNGISSGMGTYGRGSMMDFYQFVAKKVWDHPLATTEEKHYVLVACQHTLLRLLLKNRGFGTATIVSFLKETSWPVPVQRVNGGVSLASSNTVTDLDKWATKFLSQSNPIPDSLLTGGGVVDLSRFIEKEEIPQQQQEEQPANLAAAEPLVEAIAEAPPPRHESPSQELPVPPRAPPAKTMPSGQEELMGTYAEPEALDVDDDVQEEVAKAPAPLAAHDDEDAEEADGAEEEEDYDEYEDPMSGRQQPQGQDDVIDIDDDDEDEVEVEESESGDARPGEEYSEEDEEDDVSETAPVRGVVADEEEVSADESPRRAAAAAGDAESSDDTAELPEDDGYEYEGYPPGMGRGRANQGDERAGNIDSSEEDADSPPAKPHGRPRLDAYHQGRRHADDEDDEHGQSSSSEDEEAIDEESSSDGGEGGDGEHEAVVINDTSDEDDVAAPPGPRRLVDNSRRADGFAERRHAHNAQFGDAASDGDDQEPEDQDDDHPHRIAQGGLNGFSSDESDADDDDVSGSDEQDVPHRAGDQEIAQVPVEIIDDDDEDDEVRPAPGEPEASDHRSSGHDEREAADWIASILHPPREGSVEDRGSAHEEVSAERDPHFASKEGEQVALKEAKMSEPLVEHLGDPPTKASETIRPSPLTKRTVPEAAAEEHSDIEQQHPNDEEDRKSAEGLASQEDNVDSDATDDEEERVMEVEKAETEDAAVGGEFGDTTEEENEIATSSRANMLAAADRRADVLQARTGYASQLEEGYEPEDTHGYTEEEVSEAIHTEDEEEERRAAQEAKKVEFKQERPEVEPVQHSVPHSSDDMDAADEHTEPEEDFGAESSELEETAEVRDYTYSPSSEQEQGPEPTSLEDFAQRVQRLHRPRPGVSKVPAIPQPSQAQEDAGADPSGDKAVGSVEYAEAKDGDDAKVDVSIEGKSDAPVGSQSLDDDESNGETSDNFASVEDEKEADSTMATESLEMTEDTVDHGESEDLGTEPPHIASAHDDETDIDEMTKTQTDDTDVITHPHTATDMVTDANAEPPSEMLTDDAGLPTNQDNLMETESPIQEMEILHGSENEMEVEELGRAEDEPMVEGDVAPNDETMEPAIEPMESDNDAEVEERGVSAALAGDTSPDAMRAEAVRDEDVLAGEALLDQPMVLAADAAMDAQPVSIEGGATPSLTRHEPGTHVAVANDDSDEAPDDAKAEGGPKSESGVPKGNEHEAQQGHDGDQQAVATRTSTRRKKQTQNAPPTRTTRSARRVAAAASESDSEDSLPISQVSRKNDSQENKGGSDDGGASEKNDSEEDKSGSDEEDDSVAISHMIKTRRGGSTSKTESASASASAAQSNSGPTRRNKRQKVTAESPAASEEDEKPVATRPKRATRKSARAKAAQGDDDDSKDEENSVAASRPTQRRSRAKATQGDENDSKDEENSVAASRPTQRRGRAKVAQGDENDSKGEENSVAASRPTQRRGRVKAAQDDDDNDSKGEEISVASSRPTTRRAARSKKSEETPTATASRSTRGRKAKQQEKGDDESVVSTSSKKSEEAPSATASKSTRGRKAKQQEKGDDESVVSTSSKKSEEASPATAPRATRGNKAKQQEKGDDESVVSTASRTRGRGTKPSEDDSSVGSTASRRSTRARKVPAAKADEADESEDQKKPATRTRKGLPPRAPTTRSSNRRKK